MNEYFYPIVVKEREDGYDISVPDLSISMSIDEPKLYDAMQKVSENVCNKLYNMERNNEEIPKASNMWSIDVDKNTQYVCIAFFDTLEYRKKFHNKAVKKTLTVPYYLNEMALKENINFSEVLQEALKRKLGIR